MKVHEITLRELLIIQSLFTCDSQKNIGQLVNSQPNPTVFFKTFLELGFSSMFDFVAFDRTSVKSLLSSDNSDYFSKQFPIFYKNKDGRTSIDLVLEGN